MDRFTITVTFVLLSLTTCFGQSTREQLLLNYNKAKAFYDSGDYLQSLNHFLIADSLSPSHPTITYNIAATQALLSNYDEATKNLSRAILMNTSLWPEEDADFDKLKSQNAFIELSHLKEEVEAEVAQSNISFTLNESDLHPESIAYDETTNTFYVGSVHKNKIISYDPATKSVQDWKTKNEDGLWAVMGMKVNEESRELWVCTTATMEMSNYDSTLEGSTAVHRYNLATGEFIKRYVLNGGHWFGDLVIHPSGDVYISDSRSPIIYVIRKGEDELEVFQDFSKELYNLQGVCFDKEGKNLFIADYKTGLYRFNMNSGRLDFIKHMDRVITKGVDGLYFYNNNLIAIHNGVKPFRVCRYLLNEDQTSIIDYEYIDKARTELDEPTLGVLVKNRFYYVANSAWGKYDKEGNLNVEDGRKNIILGYNLD